MRPEPAAWVWCLGPKDALQALHAIGLTGPAWPEGVSWVAASAWPSALPEGGQPLTCILIEPGEADWRRQLDRLGWPYAVLQAGDAALPAHIRAVVDHAWARAQAAAQDLALGVAGRRAPRWRWVCPDCDDAECERHGLLSRLGRHDASAA